MRIAFNRICCHHRILFPAKGFPQKDSRSHGCVYCHRHGAPGSRKVPCRCPSLPLRPSGPEPHCPPSGSPSHLSTILSLLPEAQWGEAAPSSPEENGGITCLSPGQTSHEQGQHRLEAALHPACPGMRPTLRTERQASRTGGGKGLAKPG